MATNQSDSNIPGDFFEPSSFATLSGSVVITWVATSAVVSLGVGIDLKTLGLILSMIVALVGYIVSKNRSLRKLVIVPFNGLLIYLTIVGGTSFLPTNTPATPNDVSPGDTTEKFANLPRNAGSPSDLEQTEDNTRKDPAPEKSISPFFRSWNPDKELIQRTNTLSREKQQLLQTNRRYEAKLDSTRRAIQKIQISPEIRNRLMRSLEVNRNVNFRPGINQ